MIRINTSNEPKYYIYHWINDDTGKPFYIGKGSGRRYKDTKKGSRNPWFDSIIAKHKCHPEIILSGLTEQEAFNLEVEYEQRYRNLGYPLCNIVPCGGAPPHGCGQDNNNYGNHWPDEMKKAVSEKMRTTGCHAGVRNGRCRKCMRVEDGKIYDYMTQALEDLDLKCVWSIGRCLKNPINVANGYHFVGENMFEQLNTPEKRKQYLDSVNSNSRIIQ